MVNPINNHLDTDSLYYEAIQVFQQYKNYCAELTDKNILQMKMNHWQNIKGIQQLLNNINSEGNADAARLDPGALLAAIKTDFELLKKSQLPKQEWNKNEKINMFGVDLELPKKQTEAIKFLGNIINEFDDLEKYKTKNPQRNAELESLKNELNNIKQELSEKMKSTKSIEDVNKLTTAMANKIVHVVEKSQNLTKAMFQAEFSSRVSTFFHIKHDSGLDKLFNKTLGKVNAFLSNKGIQLEEVQPKKINK